MAGVEKKRRTAKPKSKGGCRTCKHVKCDELRPSCQKCTRWGHLCDGYDDGTVVVNKVPTLRNVLPKLVPQSVIIPSSLSSGIIISDELEARYFHLFQEDISDDPYPGFETTLWNRVVLQACANESIKQLTIATVALKRARKEPSTDLALQHCRYALHEYGKALKGVQTTLSLRPESLRLVVIAALLVFIFESMFEDTKRAVANIHTALNLVKQQLLPKAQTFHGPFITNAFLPPNFPDLMEEEVLKSFLQPNCSTSRPTTRARGPLSQSRPFNSKLYLEDFRIPKQFSSIDEARVCYERIRLNVFPEHVFESKLQQIASLPVGASAPAIVVMELLSETKENPSALIVLHDLTQWNQAFDPLLEYSRTEEGSSTYIATTTLQIQATAIRISLHDFKNSVRPIVPDSVASAARDIVQLSKILAADPRFAKTFVLEMGIIPCLWIVVILYPDFNLKRGAIAVLREMQPRVECVWDSKIVADTGDVVVDMLEKQNLGENFSVLF